MKIAILYYSYTGNNRLLAETLARHIDSSIVEVVERKNRYPFRIALDLLFRSYPKIDPIVLAKHDHLLVVAPLWNRWIAHPMRSALRSVRAEIGTYSFVSLSGGQRRGQAEFVRDQLEGLTGHKPVNQWALYVERVAPESVRGTPAVSKIVLSGTQLQQYPEVREIVEALSSGF